MKKCKRCKQSKEETDFKYEYYGRSKTCKHCLIRRKHGRLYSQQPKWVIRVCKKCKRTGRWRHIYCGRCKKGIEYKKPRKAYFRNLPKPLILGVAEY